MILYCITANYNHNNALKRFGTCLEWNMLIADYFEYTRVDEQYLDIRIIDYFDCFHMSVFRNRIYIDNANTS